MTRLLSALGPISLIAAAGVFGFADGARAVPEAGQVIDRTLGCLPELAAGKVRIVDLHAYPLGTVEAHDPSRKRSPGFISVGSGGWTPSGDLVSVRARRWERFPRIVNREGVYASIGRCGASRVRVPLSAAGLPGGPVRWAKHVTCLGRGRVLVSRQGNARSRVALAAAPDRVLRRGAWECDRGAAGSPQRADG